MLFRVISTKPLQEWFTSFWALNSYSWQTKHMLDHRPEHSLGRGTPWQFGMLPETLILSQTKIPKGVGTPENSLWGCATRFSKSRPYFRPKNVIFHTRFQNRSLKSTPFSDLAFRQKLRYHYLDQSANKKFFQAISNSHISLSFLLIWNWKDKYFHTLP